MGHIVRLHIPFKAFPKPQVKWIKSGQGIRNSEHYNLETTESYTHLAINKANRWDTTLSIGLCL